MIGGTESAELLLREGNAVVKGMDTLADPVGVTMGGEETREDVELPSR